MRLPFLLFLSLGMLCRWGLAPTGLKADEAAPPVYVVTVGSPVGLKAYAPGRWGTVSVVLGNRDEQPHTVRATVHLQGFEQVRFSREIWLPAKSLRQTTIPVQVPEDFPTDRRLEFIGRVESPAAGPPRPLEHPAPLLQPTAMAFVDDPQLRPASADAGTDYAYESALAVRAASGLDRSLVLNSDRFLPAHFQGWAAVRAMVLSGDRLQQHPAARQALREWIVRGGRLWIQGDQTSLATIERLLGAAVHLELVDRVPLNSFAIRYAGMKGDNEPTQVVVEEPVQLKRVLVDRAEVLFTIDGWPAVIGIDLGRGRVLINLVDSRALIRPRQSSDRPARNELHDTDFIAREPLRELATELRGEAPPPSVPSDLRAAVTAQQIGYVLPSRTTLAAVLGGFCAVVLLAAGGLHLAGRREQLIWLSGGAAVLATLVLVAVGVGRHSRVAASTASMQVMQFHPQMNEWSVSGSLASYQQDLQEVQVHAIEGARMQVHSPRLAGRIRHFVWSDGDRWRLEQAVMPAGVQVFPFERYQTGTVPVTARARFAADGLSGRVDLSTLAQALTAAEQTSPAPRQAAEAAEAAEAAASPRGPADAAVLKDAVIVFPYGRPLAANLDGDGRFVAGIGDALAENEFFNSTFIDSLQRQRRPIYQAWYDAYRRRSDDNAYLIGWSERASSGVTWGAAAAAGDEDALVVLPLEILGTRPAMDVQIPGAAVEAVTVQADSGHSIVFDNQTHRWNHPYTRPTRTRLRFQLPSSALPLQLKRASLFIDGNIPSRTLTIDVIDGTDAGERRTVYERSNASGKFTVELPPEALQRLDPEGGLTLEFIVSDVRGPADEEGGARESGWSIRETRLDVVGSTLPSNGN